MAFVLAKVVSGGQTGVDQAALRAALQAGFAIGGWCPPGRVCDAGPGGSTGCIPADFPLVETPAERSPHAPDIPRSQRTEWNVRDSDATLILRHLDGGGSMVDAGTGWTAVAAATYGQPVLVCDPRDDRSAHRVRDWLNALSIRTLNVAGPSEASAAGIGKQAQSYLRRLFRLAETCPNPAGET